MKFGALAFVFAVFAAPAMAQDVNAGRDLAQTWCKGCHNVAPGAKPMRDTGPPPFAVVANSNGVTTTALTAFLYTTHNRMPDYSLSRRQVADVSAYIMSLKSQDSASPGR